MMRRKRMKKMEMKKYDLNKYICSFYRSGNKILSKEFINYLITENDLCIELKDDYSNFNGQKYKYGDNK